jgi:hypothetical protein
MHIVYSWESQRERTQYEGLRCSWVDNIKMDLAGIGWGGLVWIGQAQDRDKWRALVNAIMNLMFS